MARVTTVTGRVDEVGAALQRAHADGRLGVVHEVVQLDDARVRVRAELAPVAATRDGWRPVRDRFAGVVTAPRVLTVVAVGTAAGVAVGAVVGVVMLVSAVVAWVTANASLLIGSGVVLAGLALFAGASGRCPGLHCGGCRR